MRNKAALKTYLDEQVERFNVPGFIKDDPISIPHKFSKKQDIEIAGLFAATLAWGLRKTIINKCNLILELMDHAPHDFIINHEEEDLKRFLSFKHRTFNATDVLFFIHFLRKHYQSNDSLETAFFPSATIDNVKTGLTYFHDSIFSLSDAPDRTKKHIATPARNSACKRLNMYLRWMVRKDNKGVDFGIWENVSPSALICPLDVHVDREARKLGLIERTQSDWKAVMELTENLRKLDPNDPVKYDFALFGLGIAAKEKEWPPKNGQI